MKVEKATELQKIYIGELLMFKRLINEVYPSGMVSIVSDTWDFWKVITEYLPALKEDIMRRDGRVIIRPDSGDPVRIIAVTISMILILNRNAWTLLRKTELQFIKGHIKCLQKLLVIQ